MDVIKADESNLKPFHGIPKKTDQLRYSYLFYLLYFASIIHSRNEHGMQP